MINMSKFKFCISSFTGNEPFDHCIVDDFLDPELALKVSSEFLEYSDSSWYVYDNSLEHKKALNNWNVFPHNTYRLLHYLNSPEFTLLLSQLLGQQFYSDPGLHGGGWHIHGSGGNLNPHLDYSIHPKMGLMRKLNIIIYLSPDLEMEHGGHLGLWTRKQPSSSELILSKEIEPKFNRAVIFDTTQDSWHGMSRKLLVPSGITRKSLAVYYLTIPEVGCAQRTKALYAPRNDQIGDEKILKLIKIRADDSKFSQAYRSKEND